MNMEVIKLAHGIYQLSLKFKESLDKVKENRKAVEEFEGRSYALSSIFAKSLNYSMIAEANTRSSVPNLRF